MKFFCSLAGNPTVAIVISLVIVLVAIVVLACAKQVASEDIAENVQLGSVVVALAAFGFAATVHFGC